MSIPPLVFKIVWPVLYALMIPTYIQLVLEKDWLGFSLFSLQLVLNIIWPILFFKKKREVLAFLDLFALWFIMFIFVSMNPHWSHQLQWPYFLWLTFALCLSL